MLEKLSFLGYHAYAYEHTTGMMVPILRFKELAEMEIVDVGFVTLEEFKFMASHTLKLFALNETMDLVGVADNNGEILWANPIAIAKILDGHSNFTGLAAWLNPELEPWLIYYQDVLGYEVKGDFSA